MSRYWRILAAILTGAVALQFSPLLIERGVQISVPSYQVSDREWRFDIRSLGLGRYYFAAGKPQGACDLLLDDRVIDSTKSALNEIRSHLFLGGGFTITSLAPDHPREAIIRCSEQHGFRVSLFHDPIVAEFYPGVALQLYREFVDSVMGPLFSLVLLLSLFLGGDGFSRGVGRRGPFLVFSVVSLAYTISLSYLNALFLDGLQFTFVHTLLRTSFSAAFVYLCGACAVQRRSLLWSHAIVLGVLAYIGCFSPTHLPDAYNFCFILFPISTAIVAYDLLNRKMERDFNGILGVIATAWAILQMHDMVRLWIGSRGPYTGPSILGIIAGLLAYFRHYDLLEQRRRSDRFRAELEKRESLLALSAQVAHDIRSPLAALSVATKDLSALSVETKSLIAGAVSRIQEISVQLLEGGKRRSKQGLHDLRPLIDGIVAEARLRYGEKSNIRIDTTFGAGSGERLFANIDSMEFQRVIANLLNNAVEAISDAGEVIISVMQNVSGIEIRITDTGIGIPLERIAFLGERGATFGKAGGAGLGLFHARSTLESWDGAFNIQSKPGKGTIVTLRLPRTSAVFE